MHLINQTKTTRKMILSILYFFIVAVGLGFLIDFLVKDWKGGFFEKLVIRLGAGVLFIPVLGVLFNTLSIPIHWVVFLGFAVLFSIIYLKRSNFNFRIFKFNIFNLYAFLVYIIFIVSAYMYISGSFSYSWFEDGDPYKYAISAKYISLEKMYSVPYYFSHTAYPYAQGYQIFMGLMHQTNDSIYWSMKFFNALIISFSLLFFFYFAKKLTKNIKASFWATFILASMPAWLSHFIFSFNFNMSLVFLLFYSLLSIEENKNWRYIGAIFYGSILINHFYTGIIITGLLLIWFLLSVLIYLKINKDYLTVLGAGFLVSMIFWIPAFFRQLSMPVSGVTLGGFKIIFDVLQNSTILVYVIVVICLIISAFALRKIVNSDNFQMILYLLVLLIIFAVLFMPSEKFINVLGLQDQDYAVSDFFWLGQSNKIDNPIGIGFVVMVLFFIGLLFYLVRFRSLFEVRNFNDLLVFTLLIISYFGLAGAKTSISVVPYRFWPFFAIFLSIISSQGVMMIFSYASKFFNNVKVMKGIIFIVLIMSISYSSFANKYDFNNSEWPEHQLFSQQARELYVWMRDGLPKNSLVLPLCNNPYVVVGYDMLSLPWKTQSLADDDVFVSNNESDMPFYKVSLSNSLEQNYNFLKSQSYNYTIIGVDCVKRMNADAELVEARVREMLSSEKFTLIKATDSEFLFKIN